MLMIKVSCWKSVLGSLKYLALMPVVLRGNRKLFDLEMILSPVIIEDVAKVSVTHRVTKVKSNENENGPAVRKTRRRPETRERPERET